MNNMRRVTDDEDESIFDERGILRDGATYRVKMTAADGITPNPDLSPLQQAIVRDRQRRPTVHDGRGGTAANSTAMNRPGYRIADTAHDGRRAAYDSAADALENAWRTTATDDATDEKKPKPTQHDGTMSATDRAYAEYDENLREKWRG
jgi:hypothetical protein